MQRKRAHGGSRRRRLDRLEFLSQVSALSLRLSGRVKSSAICAQSSAILVPTLVGVFVNASADEVRAIVEQVDLDYAQLSGDEAPATLHELSGIAFKAIRPEDEAAAQAQIELLGSAFPQCADAPSILLDAFNPTLYGGTGEIASANIAFAVKAAAPRMMLAGGLHPDNVAERVRRIRPWGVDVASGVEAGTPGIKDISAVRAFIKAVRAADA